MPYDKRDKHDLRVRLRNHLLIILVNLYIYFISCVIALYRHMIDSFPVQNCRKNIYVDNL